MIQLPQHPSIPGARYFGRSKLIIHSAEAVAEHHHLATVFAASEPELLPAGATLTAAGLRSSVDLAKAPSIGGYVMAAGSAYRALGFSSAATRKQMGRFPTSDTTGLRNGTVVMSEIGRTVSPADGVSLKRLIRPHVGQTLQYKRDAKYTGLVLTTADSAAGAGYPGALTEKDTNLTAIHNGFSLTVSNPTDVSGSVGNHAPMFLAGGALIFTRLLRTGTSRDVFLDAWAAGHELASKSGGPDKLAAVVAVLRTVLPERLELAVTAVVCPDGGAYLALGCQPAVTTTLFASAGPTAWTEAIVVPNLGSPVPVGDDWYPGQRANIVCDPNYYGGVGSLLETVNVQVGMGANFAAPAVVPTPVGSVSAALSFGPALPRSLFGVPIDALFGPAFAELGSGAMTEADYFSMLYDRWTVDTGVVATSRNTNGLLMTEAEFVAANGTKRDDWLHQGFTSGQPGCSIMLAAFLANWTLAHSRGAVPETGAVLTELTRRMEI